MRKTIDTNVLIRALVDENSEQSRIAGECLARESVHIPVTVMLETEWVLRSSYGFDRDVVCGLLGSVMSMHNVDVEQHETVGTAIIAHSVGFDFADALHLHASKGSDSFLTFDQKLMRMAAKHGSPIPVEEPTSH